MTTLLEIVQDTCNEVGIVAPTYVVGNTEQNISQLLALLNSWGRQVTTQHQWQALTVPYIFTVEVINITASTITGKSYLLTPSSTSGVDSTYQISGLGMNQATYATGLVIVNNAPAIGLSQPATSDNTAASYVLTKVKYAMPSDYGRQINRTHWDKTKHWEMLGPETAQQWEWLISGYISSGPRIRYRIFQNYFQIWPAIAINETLGFEYISKNWVLAADGTTKSKFTADTDTCIFPDALVDAALKFRFFQIKNFDISALEPIYRQQLSIAKSEDAGAKTLSMAPGYGSVLIGYANIPDAGYGFTS